MSRRILVVDDEPRWLQFALEELGRLFQVDIAATFEAAMIELRADGYDLIIASSRLLDFLKITRVEFPEKRLIVATGQPTTSEAIDMYRLGALDYFAKDFRPEVMEKKINEAIRKPARTTS